MKVNRKEIVGVNGRVDSLERVTRELMGDTQTLERTVKKFENLEKLSLLSKDIEEKLEKTKFIEDEVKRLTTKIQTIYDEIDNRLEKLRAMEREYEKTFSELEDGVTTSKKQIQKIRKDQAENFVKVLQETRNLIEQRTVEIEKDLKRKLSEIDDIQGIKLEVVKERENISKLSKEIGMNKEGIEKLHKDINDKISVVESIGPMMENKIMDIRKSLYPMVNEGLRPLHKKSADLENRIHQISDGYRKFIEESSRRFYAMENMKNSLEKKMDDVKKSVQPIVRGELKDFDRRANEMEKKFRDIKTDQINRILTDVTTRLSVIENRFSSIERINEKNMNEFKSVVREKLAELKAGAGMDEHLNEVVNRIIFLESRIRGIENSIEKIVRERSDALPIIIE
jgi:chromosome segregation ATPase